VRLSVRHRIPAEQDHRGGTGHTPHRCSGLRCLIVLLGAPVALAQVTYQFDLPAQPLADSLRAIAAQTGTNILFDSKDVKNLKAAALHGALPLNEAIRRMLARSHLEAESATPGTVIIRPAVSSHADSDPGFASTDLSADTLEEVVITAQKREELLESVPIPVTVLNATALAHQGRFRVQDYASQVPGLTVTPNEFNGSATIAIRGIISGDVTNPTVGATFDDVSLGSSTSIGGGYVVPDLDPSDLSSIEILRGPQGTLYGASSIGGLLKYVTADPSTEALSARLEAGANGVYSGGNPGYNSSASLNAPLSDSLALRGSLSTRVSPGYVDNVQAGSNDINTTRIFGGHLAALWRPSGQLTVKLSALYQHNEASGSAYVTLAPQLGELQQTFLPKTGNVARQFVAVVATVKARLGSFDLTSVTGYTRNRYVDRLDYSVPSGAFTLALFNTPHAINTDDNTTRKVSEELRLSTRVGTHLEWLVGGYFTRESSPYTLGLLAADSAGSAIGQSQFGILSSQYAEWAEFTDLTYHFSERFDIQLGGRASQIRQTYGEDDSGPLIDYLRAPHLIPESILHAHALTYLITPRLRLTPDAMIYLRAASGYRPGGINPAYFPGIPQNFKPDRTDNYELGLKADLFDRHLSIDGSLYHIDWREIQLSLTDPASGENYFTNGSGAKSEGIELSAELKPAKGLRLAGWVSYNNAVLTQAMPLNSTVYGHSGDRLPYGARFAANASWDYQFPVGHLGGSCGATMSYVGQRVGAFVAAIPNGIPERQVLSGYTQIDWRAALSEAGVWSLELYVNNVADRRGIIGGGIGTQIPTAFELIQPRTIGVSVSRYF
jgi:outer membrane receptor protein involved in Fe transport